MKIRRAFFLLIIASLALWAALASASQLSDAADSETYISALPGSLTEIGESAFEGTSLVSVRIPDTVSVIGDLAFANNPKLIAVNLSDELSRINGNPFFESRNVVLFGSGTSMGSVWAKNHNIRYYREVRFAKIKTVRLFFSHLQDAIREIQRNQTVKGRLIPEKVYRTGRSPEELKAPLNTGIASVYVQSRFFP